MTDRTPTMAEIIRAAIEDRLAEAHTVLPGRIESFDADTQKADVQPMIKRLQETIDGELLESIPVIASVPVAFPRAGGFKITFPVEPGDRCLLMFCERSIDNYQLSGLESDPESFQMHDFTDAVAYMGWYPDTDPIDGVNSSAMVAGKDNGASIHVAGDSVKVFAGDEAGRGAEFTSSGAKIFGGDQAEPMIDLSGDLVNLYTSSPADFVALALKVLAELQAIQTDQQQLKVLLTAHTHTGVTPGPGNTGPPGPPPLDFTTYTPHTPASVAADKVKAT